MSIYTHLYVKKNKKLFTAYPFKNIIWLFAHKMNK